MVKLDDVAKLAGVSKTTASRVLNSRGYISEATRDKVYSAINALNYHPNENARNFLKQRSGMIGVVVPFITNPYYSEVISYLELALRERGYKMLLCNSGSDTDHNRDYLQIFYGNRVEGAILFNYEFKDEDYSTLQFPVVSVDRFVKGGVSFVASNHAQGGILAAEHLVDRGCKRVLQISGSLAVDTPWNKRYQEFKRVIEESGAECISYCGNFDSLTLNDYAKCKEFAYRALKKYPDIDGFFGDDVWAVAILGACIDTGIPVPEQIKIVSYDGTILTHITEPPLTSIWQNTKKIAYSSVDILYQMMNDESVSTIEMTVNVELIKRKSTALPGEDFSPDSPKEILPDMDAE